LIIVFNALSAPSAVLSLGIDGFSPSRLIPGPLTGGPPFLKRDGGVSITDDFFIGF
jgi:hypothetical protein